MTDMNEGELFGPAIVSGDDTNGITCRVAIRLERDEWEQLLLLRWLDMRSVDEIVAQAIRGFLESAREQSDVKAALAVRKARREHDRRTEADKRDLARTVDTETGEIRD